ncbi:MAG: VOC family protein [Acidimicrobiales bacterium]
MTVYVDRADLGRVRDFYLALFDGRVVWDEAGHITCVGTDEIAVCVHEAEPGHPGGTRELFFRSEDLGGVAARLRAVGATVRPAGGELHAVDPAGNQVRVHAPRSAPPGISLLVPVSDIPRSVDFYCALLGLTAAGVSDEFATLRAGDAMFWLHRDDGEIELGGVELWIRVDDVDATHTRFVEAGLEGARPTTAFGPRRPASDVEAWGLRVTSAPDPDGRRVYCYRPLLHTDDDARGL